MFWFDFETVTIIIWIKALKHQETMADQGSRAGSAKSGMSQQRRERLMDIQKREQLKGMLVNKFKLKYGDKP